MVCFAIQLDRSTDVLGYSFPVFISTRFDSKGRYDSAAFGASGLCLGAHRNE
jgi:hypothetical protein